MKKMFTFLGMALMMSSAFAQWQNRGNEPKYDNRNNAAYGSTSVILKAYTEKRFTVMIDNMQYEVNGGYRNGRYDNVVNIGSMRPGKHTVTVYETYYGFFGKARQRRVSDVCFIFKPGTETTLAVNNYGQVNLSERSLYNDYGRDGKWDNDRRRDRDDDHDDHGGWKH